MTATQLLQFFAERRARAESLALVTVIETRGSTYSKAGAQMLIDANGIFRGMLSGGCLEGDLAVRASVVIDSGTPQTVEYNLAADDELWGLGVGCDGMMRVQLQRLDPDNGYEPFATIAELLARRRASEITLPIVDGKASELTIRIEPPVSLLVLGAGLDAEPVVRIAAELGWRTTVADHRPAYLESAHFEAAERTLCQPADELAARVDLADFDAAIIMSHHLVSDRAYLSQLADSELQYIGLLGPGPRRERLVKDLGDRAKRLDGRLHGPAGINFGGRGPGPIALSIIAEIQQVLQKD